MNKEVDIIGYWFVVLKQIGYDEDYLNIVQRHSFKIDGSKDRDLAKRYCIDKFGNIPFKRPKNGVNGDQYLFLVESNRYTYDSYYKEFTINCDYCKSDYKVIGCLRGSNPYTYNNKNFCCEECKERYIKEIYNSIDNENLWISETNHGNVKDFDDKKGIRVGYIYKITNKNLMISYVGKTVKPPLFRWWQHLSVDSKFEQEEISDLVFEVIEVVYYNDALDKVIYGSKENKLTDRETFYINFYDTKENGFNKVNGAKINNE